MSFQPWYYFLSIEKDFVRTIDFIELHTSNAKAFSNEYAKLLLLIGSEVDVVAKMLCAKVAPAEKVENIVDYKTLLTAKFVGIHTVEIEIPRYSLKLQPWLSWDTKISKSPDWWTSYNNVKHERDKNYADANQENTVYALCGLLALLLYFYKDEQHLQPYPDLLNYGFPESLVLGGDRPLPGV
jgi:hypothetical protein